jgi:hypothetical protein
MFNTLVFYYRMGHFFPKIIKRRQNVDNYLVLSIRELGNMEIYMKKPNYLKLHVMLILVFTMSSCAMLEYRDFEDEMSEYRDDDLSFIPNQDFEVVAGDTGDMGGGLDVILRRTPASGNEKKLSDHESSIRQELYALEGQLQEDELRQYIDNKDKIGSDSQKIYFLSLDQMEKYDYLKARGMAQKDDNSYYSSNERAIASVTNDVVLGMGKSEVARIWGQPARVDYSGARTLENERWAYRRNDKVKFIYFDSGVVEGWSEE